MLVGTVTVETSEMLSDMLKRRGIPHEVLNAKNHRKEAEIVAQAGHWGAVTIATNMAGRGTDILLGGNPEFLARRAMRQEGFDDEIIEAATGHNEDVAPEILQAREHYQELKDKFKQHTDAEHEARAANGWAAHYRHGTAREPAVSTTSCAAVLAVRATPAPPEFYHLPGGRPHAPVWLRAYRCHGGPPGAEAMTSPWKRSMLTKQIESAAETH